MYNGTSSAQFFISFSQHIYPNQFTYEKIPQKINPNQYVLLFCKKCNSQIKIRTVEHLKCGCVKCVKRSHLEKLAIIDNANENYRIAKIKRDHNTNSNSAYWNDEIAEIYRVRRIKFLRQKHSNKKHTNNKEKPKSLFLYYAKFLHRQTDLKFYKVGVTIDLENRFKGNKVYEITFEDYVEGDYQGILELEKYLLKTIKSYDNFVPPEKFGGWTECFKNPIQFREMIII